MQRQNSVKRAFRHLSVEPVVFILCIGLSVSFTVFRPAIVVKICEEVGREQFPGEVVDCQKLKDYPQSFNEEIQKRSAQLNMWNTIAGTIPPFIANFILSAWSDHVGRKSSMLIGLSGALASSCVNILIIAIPKSPIWLIPLNSCIFGFTGTITVFITACNQYLADEVKDKRTLTFRMTLLMVGFTFGFTIGSIASSFMLHVLSVPVVLMIGQIVAFPSLLYVLFFVKQHPPSKRLQNQMSETSVKSGDRGISSVADAESDRSVTDTLDSIDYKSLPPVPENMPLLPYIGFLLKDIWTTFTKPRHKRKRFYLWLSMMGYFSIGFSTDGYESLNSTYVMTPPLSFTVSSYGLYMAWGGVCITVGSIVGSAVFKKIGLSDTLIIVLSMVSTSLNPLVYALATKNWIVYLAPVASCLGMVVVGAFQSFLTALVEPTEIGKVLAGQSFSSKMSDLLSGIVINQIYRQTVHYYRATAYLVAFGLCVISTALLFGIYLGTKEIMADSYKEQHRRKEERKAQRDAQSNSSSAGSPQTVHRY